MHSSSGSHCCEGVLNPRRHDGHDQLGVLFAVFSMHLHANVLRISDAVMTSRFECIYMHVAFRLRVGVRIVLCFEPATPAVE